MVQSTVLLVKIRIMVINTVGSMLTFTIVTAIHAIEFLDVIKLNPYKPSLVYTKVCLPLPKKAVQGRH